ncbi:hypothetical protein LWI28_016943 [Acer negundo]|uniref:Leucine-rich repeat-containing N-terminal plant-type domain-containing protein n=1 Tax=Acer negundo TaxID=4023 RepID=A0AAD5JLB0_ACENE|nr:hypothetical protein LWI28_016943 [Acer negundo]
MKKLHHVVVCVVLLYVTVVSVESKSCASLDTLSMLAFKASLRNPESLGWSDTDPCKWAHVMCFNNRVTDIQIGSQNPKGTLPPDLNNLTFLKKLEVMQNQLSGSLPILSRLNALQQFLVNENNFSFISLDFFIGSIPDLSRLSNLNYSSLRGNWLSGIVPSSMVNHPKLAIVNLTGNYLQGPTPKFDTTRVEMDMKAGSNSFCLDEPGVACDPRVDLLLSIQEPLAVGYPTILQSAGQEMIRVFRRGPGTISPNFAKFPSSERLLLRNNSLTGTIPNELTTLSNLMWLDVANNSLSGKVLNFRPSVEVDTEGNPNIGKLFGGSGRPSHQGIPSCRCLDRVLHDEEHSGY